MSEKTILLVEDDEDQVILAMRAMRKHGIAAEVDEVVVAEDGEEALDYLFGTGLLRRSRRRLPARVRPARRKAPQAGPAWQVLERLRGDERTHLLPVILFSSSNEHTDVVKGYELGANSYVTKPANFEKFSEAMQYLGLVLAELQRNAVGGRRPPAVSPLRSASWAPLSARIVRLRRPRSQLVSLHRHSAPARQRTATTRLLRATGGSVLKARIEDPTRAERRAAPG